MLNIMRLIRNTKSRRMKNDILFWLFFLSFDVYFCVCVSFMYFFVCVIFIPKRLLFLGPIRKKKVRCEKSKLNFYLLLLFFVRLSNEIKWNSNEMNEMKSCLYSHFFFSQVHNHYKFCCFFFLCFHQFSSPSDGFNISMCAFYPFPLLSDIQYKKKIAERKRNRMSAKLSEQIATWLYIKKRSTRIRQKLRYMKLQPVIPRNFLFIWMDS